MAHTMVKLTATVCAAALSVAVLGGCMPQQQTSAASQAQSDNRAYMTQVNQTMETLQTRLSGFSDAVSRGDVVTMRTQADNAFKALDELDSQEAPDALKDVKQCYVDGSEQLENALNAPISSCTRKSKAQRMRSRSIGLRTTNALPIFRLLTTAASKSCRKATKLPLIFRNKAF